MKKIWIKLTKHFQGGEHTHYMLVNESVKNSDNDQNEIMQDWGENSDGGHNYGYKVDMHFMEEGELPPVEWVEKEKEKLHLHIKYLIADMKETKKTIKIFEEILAKK